MTLFAVYHAVGSFWTGCFAQLVDESCDSVAVHAETDRRTLSAELAQKPVITSAFQNAFADACQIALENNARVIIGVLNDAQINDDLVLIAQRRKPCVNNFKVVKYRCDVLISVKCRRFLKNVLAAEQSGKLFERCRYFVVCDAVKQIVERRIVLCVDEKSYLLLGTAVNAEFSHKFLEVADMTYLQPEILAPASERLNSYRKRLIVSTLCVLAADKFDACLNYLVAPAFEQCIALEHALIVIKSQRERFFFQPCRNKPCYRDSVVGSEGDEPVFSIGQFVKALLPERSRSA